MAEIDDYTFRVVDPQNLRPNQLAELNILTRTSLRQDFSHRPKRETGRLADFADDNRDDLNLMVSSGEFRPRQRFAKALTVLALSKDSHRLVAALPVADNASGHAVTHPLESRAKLRYSLLARKRIYWAGLCVLGHEARESIMNTPEEEATLTDVMLVLGTQGRHPGQPGRAYPYDDWRRANYDGEPLWEETLGRQGYRSISSSRQEVKPFGPRATPVEQTTWAVRSIALLQYKGLQHEGMEGALAASGFIVGSPHINRY